MTPENKLPAMPPLERIGTYLEDIQAYTEMLSDARYALGREATADSFASSLGVDLKVILSWENGKSLPNNEQLPAVADLYKIELGKLEEAVKKARIALNNLPANRPREKKGGKGQGLDKGFASSGRRNNPKSGLGSGGSII